MLAASSYHLPAAASNLKLELEVAARRLQLEGSICQNPWDWVIVEARRRESIALAGIAARLTVDDVYRDELEDTSEVALLGLRRAPA